MRTGLSLPRHSDWKAYPLNEALCALGFYAEDLTPEEWVALGGVLIDRQEVQRDGGLTVHLGWVCCHQQLDFERVEEGSWRFSGTWETDGYAVSAKMRRPSTDVRPGDPPPPAPKAKRGQKRGRDGVTSVLGRRILALTA
ncbi:hypothetical protein ACKKBG_A16870 [Auxenochlorella protothecoides x Auxenochlorella symbiontica]